LHVTEADNGWQTNMSTILFINLSWRITAMLQALHMIADFLPSAIQ